jgi:phosphate transport system substrate-binding protein
MRRRTVSAVSLVVVLAAVASAVGASASLNANASLTGAGSSFVAPLVQKWISNVGKGLDITYAPVGSGGGINAITGRTVDFGASDAPLTPDQSFLRGGSLRAAFRRPGSATAARIPESG